MSPFPFLFLLSPVVHPAGRKPLTGDGPWQRFRVTAAGSQELTPALFDAAREHGWRLAELRPDPKTLETVFRDLAALPAGGSPAAAASKAVAS